MTLPATLRAAIGRALEGHPPAELLRGSDELSARYRAETRDGRRHVDSAAAARAYLAVRLPATFAATTAAFAAAASARPDFSPATLLDFGAGPGTATWAAAATWPSLGAATLIEASGAMRAAGEALGAPQGVRSDYFAADLAVAGQPPPPGADLVVLAYVLGELQPAQRTPLIERLWSAAAEMLVIVEPGTTAGWQRILLARDRLLAAGAHIVAPCPHAAPCPVSPPDWCHFSARLDRSRVHRLAKGAERSFEDEKFAYLVAARTPSRPAPARVIARPLHQSGRATLKLCRADGTLAFETISRREGDRYRDARRAEWGDPVTLPD